MVSSIIIVFLFVFIVYRDVENNYKVNRLLDRLMARDLQELRAMDKPYKAKETKSMNDRTEYERACKAQGIEPEKEGL